MSHNIFPWLAVPPPAPAPAPVAAYYQDDEPVEDKKPLANNGRGLVLKTHCEFPAIGRGTSRDKFAVLVHAKAPADVARAPLDLVTVLDVSGSMNGEKLALLKQAMGFVIDQLGPADRLSVVFFSDRAGRLTRLARMSGAGKASAKLAVESLVALAGTNIREGLHVGAQVLVGRRHKNSVASMILLSDGQDSYVRGNYMDLVPPSFKDAGSRPGPIHTFGFGATHDAAALHTVAEATGGTFSFVGNQAAIQNSFAQCIGGLLSVAV
ncbi:E3 ubiquitin-protein ligase WAV3 [Triticum aestivum]|uniref:E3 ubiquitin-protein ligase WAV3 n=1 Tax=Triticum aestivum TaxID=4565 RepID=UPI001D010A49|nr:E3 ubiquitin-protein ligase WAV3-like [Triticum aestivum]